MVLPAPTPEFLTQYSNAKTLVQTALLENRNIVLLGNKGANGKTFLQNEMKNDSKFANYDIFYDRIVNNNQINSCFWLETLDTSVVDQMTSNGIDFCRIDMPVSLLLG